MKTLLKLLMLLAAASYLVFAFARLVSDHTDEDCTLVDVVVTDSAQGGFITRSEVARLLRQGGLYPLGQPMDSIRLRQIKRLLLRNTFIKEAVCYKSPGGRLHILVSQHLPVLRVMADSGEDYYVDETGRPMQSGMYHSDLVVATGQVDTAFVRRRLVHVARYIEQDPFWNNQITQINVTPQHKLELVPRVGDHIVEFGTATDVQAKLRNLRAIYQKVLPQAGWNTYAVISLEYAGQVACKKAAH